MMFGVIAMSHDVWGYSYVIMMFGVIAMREKDRPSMVAKKSLDNQSPLQKSGKIVHKLVIS